MPPDDSKLTCIFRQSLFRRKIKVCRRCGRQVSSPHPPRKLYGFSCRGRRGLGDIIAEWIKWLGIKKKPGCGCDKRQQALNRAGARLGL